MHKNEFKKEMRKRLRRNSAERKFRAKFSFTGNSISKSDADTQLIHLLGNPQNYGRNGLGKSLDKIENEFFLLANYSPHDKEVYNEYINNSQNNIENNIKADTYRLLAVENDTTSGLNAAVLEHKRPDGTKEILLWADGSKGFNNFKLKDFKTTKELYQDWFVADLATLFDNINKQTKQLREFALNYMTKSGNKIDRAVGISLAGIALSTLGYTQGFGDIEIHTYSGITSEELMKKAVKLWGDNGKNGKNMIHHIAPREVLIQLLRPCIGAGKLYIKDESGNKDMVQHGAEIYNNKNGENSVYYEAEIKKDFPMWHVTSPFVTLNRNLFKNKLGENKENWVKDNQNPVNKVSANNTERELLKQLRENSRADIGIADKIRNEGKILEKLINNQAQNDSQLILQYC